MPFLGVPQVWESTGYTGHNVKVAIIDTGIDYTHATFGGPGTVAAFDAAKASSAQPADPTMYGPDAPRVKGGIDLVGDDYNADPNSASYQPVPHPDDNPLDCNGHGSHVAGTAGGSGVLADGTAYRGPYDSTTPSNPFRVGPGVAPQVDLYAVRVFGCEGSTDVVVPALDWAVDHGMDVVNMSLGSSFGRADDPDAVAAANAVGAGVVVVASSGNAGHNPYLTGSPGNRRRCDLRVGRRQRRGVPGRDDHGRRHPRRGDQRERRLPRRHRRSDGRAPHRRQRARMLAGGVHRRGCRAGRQPDRGSSTAGRAPVSPRPSTASRRERRRWSW